MVDTTDNMGTTPEKREVDFSSLNLPRIGHNYLTQKHAGEYSVDNLNLLNGYVNYVLEQDNQDLPVYKVGLVFVCINQPYWQYAQPVIDGAKNLFLPGHDTEIMMWSDMPNYPEAKDVNYGVTIFPTESVTWPYPTLMRYHLFLQQEEYLKKFDYVFYVDLDMRIVNVVGDEILGDGLTAAEHPMFSLRENFWYPYEPNPNSTAYIPRPGRIVVSGGKQKFQPLYAAGGIQGGKTEEFIAAMKQMKEMIDIDMANGYIARWNDESHWNRYLFDHPPSVVLSPSYVYPDSMIEEYYKPLWGRDYPPKIITLTKPFSTSKEGGQAAREMMENMKGL